MHQRDLTPPVSTPLLCVTCSFPFELHSVLCVFEQVVEHLFADRHIVHLKTIHRLPVFMHNSLLTYVSLCLYPFLAELQHEGGIVTCCGPALHYEVSYSWGARAARWRTMGQYGRRGVSEKTCRYNKTRKVQTRRRGDVVQGVVRWQ